MAVSALLPSLGAEPGPMDNVPTGGIGTAAAITATAAATDHDDRDQALEPAGPAAIAASQQAQRQRIRVGTAQRRCGGSAPITISADGSRAKVGNGRRGTFSDISSLHPTIHPYVFQITA